MTIHKPKTGKRILAFIGLFLWMAVCTSVANTVTGVPTDVHSILLTGFLSVLFWMIGYSVAYTVLHLPVVRTGILLKKFQREVERVHSGNVTYMAGFAEAARAGEAFFSYYARAGKWAKRSDLLDAFCRYWTDYDFLGTDSMEVMARIDAEALCLSLILNWDTKVTPTEVLESTTPDL